MSKKRLNYLYTEHFNRDCEILKSRGIPFETYKETIVVPQQFEVVLIEFAMTALLFEGESIHIMNNADERFGHAKEEPLKCPKIASELYMRAIKDSKSWYYVIRKDS
jgi:hypothetical protein